MAEKKGFSCLYGGFVAHWIHWQDAEIMLLWDRAVDVTSREGYRQLKLYFTGLWELVAQMNWQSQWMQCLVDEPQFANSAAYRILSDICRKCMPGVTIHDPVETYEIGGATDVWCLKQAQFDQYRAIWKELQGMGERLWVYTCGFPAGKVMNRATDLPLLAGRLPFWLCAREGFEGFLHWGDNAWNGRARKRLHRLPREGWPGQQPARADSALRRGGLRAAAAAAGGGNPSAVREAVYRLFAVCHGREDLCAGSQGAASQRPLTRPGRINSLRRPHGVSGSFFVRLDARAAVPAHGGRSLRSTKRRNG